MFLFFSNYLGYQGRYGERLQKQQHKTFESFFLLEDTSIAWKILGCWRQALLSGGLDTFWLNGIYSRSPISGNPVTVFWLLNQVTKTELQMIFLNLQNIYLQEFTIKLCNTTLYKYLSSVNLQLYVEGLCHGNLSEKEATSIANIFTNTFLVDSIPARLRHKERVICLPSGSNLVRSVSVKNVVEVNSVVEVSNFFICIITRLLVSWMLILCYLFV